MKLHGIFPPVTTPFDHNGDIYQVKVRHNIEKWNRTTLAGYVVCGSTGESVFLSSEEKVRLFGWVAEAAAPDKILIAGTGAESVRETVELSDHAAKAGYAAALVRNPSYYKVSMSRPETQLLFFRSVADRAKIPVLIYNFPQVTGIDIAPETIAALSEHPNIIGMKDSSGKIEKVGQVLSLVKPGFQMLVGSARTLADAFAAGAVGGIVAFACAAPYAMISIHEAHRTRDTVAAKDWQTRITPASDLVTTKYGIPGLKHAMDLNGYYGGPPRLPFAPVGPDARLEIERAFDGIKG